MCRHAAYLGHPIPLKQFLLDPPHSLEVQAYAPRELQVARLNADGFGFAWYGTDRRPVTYVNAMPIWSDVNLEGLGRTLHSGLWLGSVRSASVGFPSGPVNTQPFRAGGYLYSHNGYLAEFNLHTRPHLARMLAPEITEGLCGNTDSEYIFALIRQLLLENPDLSMAAAIVEAFGLIAEWQDEHIALLNLIVVDGRRIYATRHAINSTCPTLYFTTDDESFPEGSQLVASERMTEASFWQAVPEHHLLILDPEKPPELLAL